MQITCPSCGNACEVDGDVLVGQQLLCPFCSHKFSYSGLEQEAMNPNTKEKAIAVLRSCEGYGNVNLQEDESGNLSGTHPNGLPARIAGSDKTGWFEVHGGICRQWLDRGGPTGELGLPVSNEEPDSDYRDKNGKRSRFQHGTIHGWPTDPLTPKGAWSFEVVCEYAIWGRAQKLCRIASSLRTQREIRADDLSRIQAETTTLTARVNDQRLYLGIVGEFSTGKSTFINALLGFELLKEDILQGTTCAPTLLSKGNDFTIIVNFQKDKRSARYPASNATRKSRWCIGDDMEHALECIRRASEFISKYTAEEDVSKTVADVRIEIPGDYWHLPDNIVIVDTPGLNADNPRHGMVTREAVRNVCDLCCVLTSASIPCSATLIHFVSENLREIQGRCVCVATQMDRLRRREREGLVNYISERLTSEGLSFKNVFGLAPIYVSHPEERHSEAETFRTDFSDFVRRLSSMLEVARNDVIIEKMGRLTRHLADETLRPMLESMRSEFTLRKKALASNRLANPDSFFKMAKEKAITALQSAKCRVAHECHLSLDRKVDDIRKKVEERIDHASSVDGIKSVLSESLSNSLDAPMREELQRYLQGCREAATVYLEQFKTEFNAAYRNLCPNASVFQVVTTSKMSVRLPQMDFSGAVGAVAALDMLDNDQRLGNAAVGVAAGAAAGAWLFGIGAIPGALIGGTIGAIFGGKDISEFKGAAKRGLASAVKGLRQKVSTHFDEQSQLLLDKIVKDTDAQMGFYQSRVPEIRAIIAKEEAELDRLDRLTSDVNADLRSLKPFLNP